MLDQISGLPDHMVARDDVVYLSIIDSNEPDNAYKSSVIALDANRQRITLADGVLGGNLGLSVDATDVYIANAGNCSLAHVCSHQSIFKIPRTGGAPAPLLGGVAAPAPGSSALALDGGFYYFSGFVSPGSISRAPLAGGPSEMLESTIGGFGTSPTYELVVRDGAMCWSSLAGGSIQIAPTTGGAFTTLDPGTGAGYNPAVAMDATNVYFTQNRPVGSSSVIDLVQRPRAGGAAVVLVSGEEVLDSPLVIGDHVYFTSLAGVERVAIGGGDRSIVVAAETSSGLATDGTHLFYTAVDKDLRTRSGCFARRSS